MIRLQVAKGDLDLIPGMERDFYITRQINNIFNLNNRNSDYTKTISLPNSPGNRDKLGIVSNETRPPDRAKCSLYINDLAFSINSELLINKITDYVIEATLLINASILFSLIPDDSIKNLDFTEFNFTWDLTGVAAINAETTGAIFGRSCYFDMPNVRDELIIGGSTGFDNYSDLWVYGFAFYLKSIFDKICSNAGFAVDDSLVSAEANYDDSVFFCPVRGLVDQDLDNSYVGLADMQSPPQTITGTTATIDLKSVTDPLTWWNNTTNKWDIGATRTYNITYHYNVTVTISGPLSGPGCRMFLKVGSTVIHSLYWNASGSYSGTINTSYTIASGSTLWLEGFAATGGGYSNVLQVNSGTDLAFTSSMPLFSRDLIVSDWLPDMNQRTFISAFLSLSNTVMDVDDPSKTIVLRPFDKIFYRNPLDITAKFNRLAGHSFNYSLSNYYQQSALQYANYMNTIRTDLVFKATINNANLDKEGVVLNIPFEGSDSEVLFTYDTSYTPAFKGTLSNETGLTYTTGTSSFSLAAAVDFSPGDFIDSGTNTVRIASKTSTTTGTIVGTWVGSVSNAAWDLIKFSSVVTGPRVGLVDWATSPTMNVSDGDMTIGGGASTFACRHIRFSDGLTPESLYNTFYKNILDLMETFLSIEAWLILDADTFKNMDLTVPVIIQDFGAKFYINILEQWKPGGLVRAELIRFNKQD